MYLLTTLFTRAAVGSWCCEASADHGAARMKTHSGAKTCVLSRVLLVRRILEEGRDRGEVACSLGISLRTVQKWLRRYRLEGRQGLQDRSSAPRGRPQPWSAAAVERVLQLRRRGLTGVAVARTCGVPRPTVSRILRKHRLSRQRDIEPSEPARRYEHAAPGDLLHVDTKKLARIGRVGHRIDGDRSKHVRGIGWEFVHVCIDDHSRLSYVEVLPDECKNTTEAFLDRAFGFFAARGVRPSFTRPYRPRTNGKAERFIQTALREWAYYQPYSRSTQRTLALRRWLHYYNHHRQHSALGGRPPASRVNNLVRTNN